MSLDNNLGDISKGKITISEALKTIVNDVQDIRLSKSQEGGESLVLGVLQCICNCGKNTHFVKYQTI